MSKTSYHFMNTSEAATLKYGGNKYEMILAAANRAREIKRGKAPLVRSQYGPVVTALMEIEQGKIGPNYIKEGFANARAKRKPNE